MSLHSLWALEILRMSPTERANTGKFSPYCVTPGGSLRLAYEDIRRKGARVWPVGRAPGWTKVALSDGSEQRIWLPLGSDFDFAKVGGADFADLVLHGKAFPFCGHKFVLPEWEKFIMNYTECEVDNMEKLGMFVGYRGQSRQYDEMLAPALYRKHQNTSATKRVEWERRRRIAGNILKQRFLENDHKALTEIETIGILQHYKVIGPTDMLDLSHDLNVAKWFALNESVGDGHYRQKKFDHAHYRTDGRGGSCVYTVAVRVIGMIPFEDFIDGMPPDVVESARHVFSGMTFQLWRDFALPGQEAPFHQRRGVPPWNLAPIWCENAERQRAFGLRGIGPGEVDEYGSILSVTEHLFHPEFHPNGWDGIGGPELMIKNQRFAFDEDSSHMASYLFPERLGWLQNTFSEISQTLKKMP